MLHKIITALFFIFFSYAAAADEILIIKNVKVSASDKNSSIARNIALEKGQVRSFQELIKRHYPAASDKASRFSEAQIF